MNYYQPVIGRTRDWVDPSYNATFRNPQSWPEPFPSARTYTAHYNPPDSFYSPQQHQQYAPIDSQHVNRSIPPHILPSINTVFNNYELPPPNLVQQPVPHQHSSFHSRPSPGFAYTISENHILPPPISALPISALRKPLPSSNPTPPPSQDSYPHDVTNRPHTHHATPPRPVAQAASQPREMHQPPALPQYQPEPRPIRSEISVPSSHDPIGRYDQFSPEHQGSSPQNTFVSNVQSPPPLTPRLPQRETIHVTPAPRDDAPPTPGTPARRQKRSQSPRRKRTQSPPPPPSKTKDTRRKREKKFPCPGCEAVFERPSSLRQHMLSHTGEKPHACQICGRRFSVASNLRRHDKSCGAARIRLQRAGKLPGRSYFHPYSAHVGSEPRDLPTQQGQAVQEFAPSSNMNVHGSMRSDAGSDHSVHDSYVPPSEEYMGTSSPTNHYNRGAINDPERGGTIQYAQTPLTNTSSASGGSMSSSPQMNFSSPRLGAYPQPHNQIHLPFNPPQGTLTQHIQGPAATSVNGGLMPQPPRVPSTSTSNRNNARFENGAPQRWIPASLKHLKNVDDLTSSAPFKLGMFDSTAVCAPLRPVKPHGVRLMPGRDDLATNDDLMEWEERNSYDTNVPAEPYHPSQWRDCLPGPGLLDPHELTKDAHIARRYLLTTS